MKIYRLIPVLLAAAILLLTLASLPGESEPSAMQDAIVLVIRHAEKPDKGPELNAAGVARARAYVEYFRNYRVDGQPMRPDYLLAAADSKASQRPYLTLEPTAKMLGLVIDSRFNTDQSRQLAAALSAKPHGKLIVICWHHGDIPALLQALGASPGKLLPKGKWPDSVFDWVIQLRYDANGRPAGATRITEPF